MNKQTMKWALLPAAAGVLLACGGGGGGGDPGSSASVLSGTAATGAPMSGATIVVTDSTGKEVQNCNPCVAGTDGTFSIELKSGAAAPFVLKALMNGQAEPQVSVVSSNGSSTVNITPITTLVAARLASNGDPASLTASGLTLDTINTAVSEIRKVLKPLLDAVGMAETDNPVTISFSANGKGLDKALDALGKLNIVRDSSGNATVEAEIKISGTDGTADVAPPKITLERAKPPVASSTFTTTNIQSSLPADGVSPQITELIGRMTACYAQPQTQRVNNGGKLPTDIISDTCKGLFIDNAPSKYLHNNSVVSMSGTSFSGTDYSGRFAGSFSGIFGTLQGLQYDQPEYRYTVKSDNTSDATKPMNGDVVFTARWTVTDAASPNVGQVDVSEFHARPQNGQLRLVGNQSKHDFSVLAQARREIMPAAPTFDYIATGYNIAISERRWNHDNNISTPSISIYKEIKVTAPNGSEFLLKPIPGNNYDYLGQVYGGVVSSTSTIRLNAKFQDASRTDKPQDRFNEFWAKTPWSDADIAAIPSQGNWRFDVTLTQEYATAHNVAEKFTQWRRTINRAPTLPEVSGVAWPALVDSQLASFKASVIANNGGALVGTRGVASVLPVDWTVSTYAWNPLTVKIYGSNWDESRDVPSTARNTTIYCKGTQSVCVNATATTSGQFMNANYYGIQFLGRDSKRVQMNMIYRANTRSDK